jgi:hypothetical protein
MKKFIAACLPVVFILLCIALYACNKSKPVSGENGEYTRAMAEKAGIDPEKNPGALVTREDLQNGARATVVGMLRLVGTARFSQLVVTPPANFDIYLKAERDQIPDYEDTYSKYVEVTGVVSIDTLRSGDIVRERYSMTVEKLRRIQ